MAASRMTSPARGISGTAFGREERRSQNQAALFQPTYVGPVSRIVKQNIPEILACRRVPPKVAGILVPEGGSVSVTSVSERGLTLRTPCGVAVSLRRPTDLAMARIVGIKVIFHTTRDDEDDQDVVNISLARRDGHAVAAPLHVGQGNKWDNNTQTGPFFLGIAPQDSSALDLTVSKSGTDGRIFHATVVGVLEGGGEVTLINRSEEVHLENGDQTKTWRLP